MSQQPTHPEVPGGSGDVYLSPTEQNRLIATLLNPRRRFKLHDSVKAYMVRQSCRNMRSRDGRVSNRAVSNLLKMESMNQRDEHHSQDLLMSKQAQLHLHQHDQAGQVVVYIPDNGRPTVECVGFANLSDEQRQARQGAIAAGVRDRIGADAGLPPPAVDFPVTGEALAAAAKGSDDPG